MRSLNIGDNTWYERTTPRVFPGGAKGTFTASEVYLKRLMDVTAAAAGIVLLAPLWFVIALLIKLDSAGPVFYKQRRYGENLREFDLFKFRSMKNDADGLRNDLAGQNEMDGPIFKIKDDPRITRVGKWLRRFSLDEFPQLINVLRREMSLVGPRPPIPEEVAEYEPWQMKRLSVPQGITGLWQVSGRNLLTFDEMVKLDIYYADNWSFRSDINILIRTLPAVLGQKGAY